jgi:hypothetical protein
MNMVWKSMRIPPKSGGEIRTFGRLRDPGVAEMIAVEKNYHQINPTFRI